MSDLYSKILEGGEDISELCYDLYAVSVEGADSVANQQDKLWLLSEFELTSFFASEQERAWTSSYWLRSPLAEGSLMMPQYVFGVGEDGAYLSEGAWCGDNYGVRPCFKIA